MHAYAASTCVRGGGERKERVRRSERSFEGDQVEHVLARGESDSVEYQNAIFLSASSSSPSLFLCLLLKFFARNRLLEYFLRAADSLDIHRIGS